MRSCVLTCVCILVASVLPTAASAADVDYVRQIRPLLHEKCNACHGALKQKAGLRTDAVQLLRRGGDSGPLVVPGKPEESLLVHAVEGTHDAEKMPLDGAPLTAEQLALLRSWIRQGAKADDEPVPASPAEHWAFKLPTRPAVPKPTPAAGAIRNPIDAFVSAERQSRGLSSLKEAPRHLLLRRLYLDLVGVPPTPAEMQTFLDDQAPDAYEKVVDRLLADTRYGQRWGRHWMDVWRYSDWAGYNDEIRESRRGIWRWRDWIIESVNGDRPYDEMVRLMIAADEQAVDPADLRAGGYLARSWYKFNKNIWMDNTVEHFGKAFLGLTLNCARCHDHKYDPIEQTEYYQLRAIFEPIDIRSDPVAGLPEPERDGIALVYDKNPAEPTYLLHRGDEKQPVKDRQIAPAVPAVFGWNEPVRPVELPVTTWYPGRRHDVRTEILSRARGSVDAAKSELSAAEKTRSDEPETVAVAKARLAAADADLVAVEAKLAADDATYASPHDANALLEPRKKAEHAQRLAAIARAEAEVVSAKADLVALREAASRQPATGPVARPGKKPAKPRKPEEVQKALTTAEKRLNEAKETAAEPLGGKYAPLTATYPQTSTGRRSSLAAWVTSPRNPLTARVAINHLWMRHFGSPLVATEFDFGLNGKAPTHPALLDWLAVEFMERGWSMKAIHRLMVTSATYRLSSGDPRDAGHSARYAANQALDPDNTYHWRANVRRMDAEVVRDSVLAVAGKLDTSLGRPELDEHAWQSSSRRSLYYRHAYEKQGVFSLVFDAPSPTECYRRIETVTPQQSLALANSALAVSHARLLAAELAQQTPPGDGPSSFVRAAFSRVLSRPATDEEVATCAAFIETQSKLLAARKSLTPHDGIEKAAVAPATDPAQRARENLVHVLLNHNDFVTIR